MNLPDFLKFNRQSFSTKIFYLFTACFFIAFISFSLTFIYYQSNTLKSNLIQQGKLLTGLLARSARLGVFAENKELLKGPVESICHHKEIILVQIFTDSGTQLTSAVKQIGTESGCNLNKNGAMDREALETVKNSRSLHYSENKGNITFWAPVFSGWSQGDEYMLDANRPDKDNIIGYVKIVFTTDIFNEEIKHILKTSIVLPVFLLIPMWIIVFFFLKRITKPLNVLTEGVTAVGTGSSVNKVSVETGDEIGKLADAFNNMVTSLETKETEKKQVEEQLRQSQKIEAVGTLARGVAHDFNNILSIIIGYGGLIRKKVTFKNNEKKYINNLISTAEKASSITQSLLTFSRQEAFTLKPVKINEIIINMENILKRFLNDNIELKIDLSKENSTVLSDPGLIEQVLINLITNAKHAMPDGGSLTINTAFVTAGNDFHVTTGKVEAGNYALITVKDTGTGMNSRTKENIFDPFFTTKDVGKGTGLGLTMVYAIIQQHKGYIDVTTSPGNGTSFGIYLRLTDLPASPTEGHKLTEPVTGTETILIAEDNDELRILTTDMLKEYGYRIITAPDGEEAIKKFKEHQDRIDLLLLDVVMPIKNGKEVFDAARELRPDIKALFISAYTAEVRKMHESQFSDSQTGFMQKPFLPENLLRKVREILDN